MPSTQSPQAGEPTQYAIFDKRTGRYYSTDSKSFTSKPFQRGEWGRMVDLFIADESTRLARESGELILIAA